MRTGPAVERSADLPAEAGLTEARHRLIEDLRTSGFQDLDLLQRFDRIPRHVFLPDEVREMAYQDRAVPLGHDQHATPPSLLARYLDVLAPGADDRVLEVGTGSGFLTALLALTSERVYSVEPVRMLSLGARRTLDRLGLQNVALMVGDGGIGWPRYGPYQVVAVTAAACRLPDPLLDQLADPGRMLLPVEREGTQQLVLVRKEQGRITQEVLEGELDLEPLVGRWGPSVREER